MVCKLYIHIGKNINFIVEELGQYHLKQVIIVASKNTCQKSFTSVQCTEKGAISPVLLRCSLNLFVRKHEATSKCGKWHKPVY
jgi:hypothetical protein